MFEGEEQGSRRSGYKSHDDNRDTQLYRRHHMQRSDGGHVCLPQDHAPTESYRSGQGIYTQWFFILLSFIRIIFSIIIVSGWSHHLRSPLQISPFLLSQPSSRHCLSYTHLSDVGLASIFSFQEFPSSYLALFSMCVILLIS